MTASRVLVIDSAKVVGEQIWDMLEGFEGGSLQVLTTDLDNAEQTARRVRPCTIILNLAPSIEGALAVGAKLLTLLPETTLIVTAPQPQPELVLKAMRAGARDFIPQPIDEAVLVKSIRGSLVAKLREFGNIVRRPARSARPRISGGKIVAVFSNKGGLGNTSVAVNLAAALTAMGRLVAIVDLASHTSDVATFIDVEPNYRIIDLLRDLDSVDPQLAESSLSKHESGLRIIAQPQDAGRAELEPQQVEDAVNYLKLLHHYVVVDTGHQFEERYLRALDVADEILVLATQNLVALRRTRSCFEALAQLGYSPPEVKLVINRYLLREEITDRDIEDALGTPVFWTIPNDYAAMIHAINHGETILESAPRSALAESYRGLARKLSGDKLRTP